MSGKHAYLIMAHNEFGILEKQLRLLDDERNDLYIHIDKKVKNFDPQRFQKAVTCSHLYFIERIDTRWGHFSLVQCELNLLKEAVKQNYQYYHLISGVDLPLKTNDEIHEFFDRNAGQEFIHFQAPEANEFIWGRVSYYHAMKYFQTGNKYVSFLGRNLDFLVEALQNKAKFERKWDENVVLQYGSQWFSITHPMAEYVVSKEAWIQKYFSHTSAPDELVMQTIVYNSEFRDKLYRKERDGNYAASARFIDWERGAPYTFRSEDYQALIGSDRMFARKFSTKVDSQVIDDIFSYLQSKQRTQV